MSVYSIRVRNPNNGKEATVYTTRVTVQRDITKYAKKAGLELVSASDPLEDFNDASLALEVLGLLLA